MYTKYGDVYLRNLQEKVFLGFFPPLSFSHLVRCAMARPGGNVCLYARSSTRGRERESKKYLRPSSLCVATHESRAAMLRFSSRYNLKSRLGAQLGSYRPTRPCRRRFTDTAQTPSSVLDLVRFFLHLMCPRILGCTCPTTKFCYALKKKKKKLFFLL